MSIERVGEALQRFLTGQEPQAIALTGSWGSGKTHFWGEQLKKYLESAAEPLPVAYVSLFGLSSISEVKDAIFENTEKYAERPPEDSIFDAEVNADLMSYFVEKSIGAVRKLSPYALKLPDTSKFGAFAKAAAFKSVGKQIICLDDLERKGDGLKPKDIFGLVSFLKEQRKCKVIVVLNDDALDKEKKEFEKHREKIFDFEIRFSPSSEWACSHVFMQDNKAHQLASRYVQKAKITNIRILKRVAAIVDRLAPFCDGLESEVLEDLVQNIVVLTWAYNSKEKYVPGYEYLKEKHRSLYLGVGKQPARPPEELMWDQIISAIDFRQPISDIGNCVCDYLESGVFCGDSFASACSDFHESVVRNIKSHEFHESWRLFHDSFSDNENKFVETMMSTFIENVENIAIYNANGAFVILREFGRNHDASKLIDLWVEKNVNDRSFTAKEMFSDYDMRDVDAEFEMKLTEKINSYPCLVSLASAVEKIDRGAWNREDEDAIVNATEDEIFNYMQSQQNLEPRRRIQVLLRRGFGLRGDTLEAQNRAISALLRISASSRINALRIRRMAGELSLHELPAPSSAEDGDE